MHGSAGQCWVPRGTRYLNACGIDTALVLPLDDTYRLYLARENIVGYMQAEHCVCG